MARKNPIEAVLTIFENKDTIFGIVGHWVTLLRSESPLKFTGPLKGRKDPLLGREDPYWGCGKLFGNTVVVNGGICCGIS